MIENATQITVPNATVAFFKGTMGDIPTYIQYGQGGTSDGQCYGWFGNAARG